ncbi:FlgD immunoglobulin-like domain containing protein [Candidatus Latescibacterota bacterium]
MKHLIISLIISLSFYCGTDLYALENGTWIHHERQAPTSNIQSIYSLPDGNIIVDTIRGSDHNFHVFDGVKWKKTSKSTSVIGSNPPLISDSNGRFYFLKSDSLVVWDYYAQDNSIQKFVSDATGKLSAPMTAAISGDNTLYLASFAYDSKGGIYKFDGNTVEKIKPGPTKSIAVDTTGRLWAAHKDSSRADMRLLVMEDEWTDLTDEIDPLLIQKSIENNLKVKAAPDGRIWVTNIGKYSVYKDGNWSYHDGGSVGSTMSLAFDKAGRVWGYGDNDIYLLNNEGNWQMSYLKVESSPSINGDYFIASDNSSKNWFFYLKDIYQYSESSEEPWTKVTSNLDLGSNIITSIAYTLEGYLVCGHGMKGTDPSETEDAGISILKDSTWYNYKYPDVDINPDRLSFRNVDHLLEIDDGDILIYADPDSYSLYDGRRFVKTDSLRADDDNKRNPNDMIIDNMGDLWIATDAGILQHDFIDFSSLYYSPPTENWYINYFNIFQASNGTFYLQSTDDDYLFQEIDGTLLSFNPKNDYDLQWFKIFDGTRDNNSLIRDFVVEIDGNQLIFWIIRGNYLYNNKKEFYNWGRVKSADTDSEVSLPNASLIHFEEEEGIIWASGYDNTGYISIEDGVWHRIPELSGYASNVFKQSEDGNIALNAIVVNEFGDYPTKDTDDDIEYYGLFEFIPGLPSVVSDDKPVSFPVTTNYPNPFNASTTIQFELPRREKVTITIYNILGRHVRTLAEGTYPAGTLNVVWDSKSDTGNSVASGLYLYSIKTENAEYTGKMLLLR